MASAAGLKVTPCAVTTLIVAVPVALELPDNVAVTVTAAEGTEEGAV